MLPHWKMPIQCFWPTQNAVTFSQATISASTIRKTNFLVPPKISQSLKRSPVCVQRCVCELINCQVYERCLSIHLAHWPAASFGPQTVNIFAVAVTTK